MSEFKPCADRADLSSLNDADIVDGYCAGLIGDAEPGSDKSRSYWHGWRNGMADSGRMDLDDAMRKLASEVVAYSRAH
ncbi:hypothetical protein ACQUFY_10870 [Robbsia andropogonis]|uniref:hypothetical protein n=1 Tax=Robbsia andropogonis TaxID=28092 RepID=UPI003D1E6E3B